MNITFKTNNLNDLAMLVQLAKRLNIEVIENNEQEFSVDELTKLSFESFESSWNTKEDDVWDSFFDETQIEK
ncbi:MAG: hypothetical protein COZ18_00630 [Flexibacter sp. CG_4_10_14_3_um_filter_32_15]|nr:MAG: hypothetical protein COZ18_00630 [Flexibacter sp. CG_4_10_14_3_um_filter_32_15]